MAELDAGELALKQLEDHKGKYDENLNRLWETMEKYGDQMGDFRLATNSQISDFQLQNAQEHNGLITSAFKKALDRVSKKEAYIQSFQWALIASLVVYLLTGG